MRHKAEDLAKALAEIGPESAVDIDEAGMRLTLDIVGLVHILSTLVKAHTHLNSIKVSCKGLENCQTTCLAPGGLRA